MCAALACPTLSDFTSFRSVQPTQGDKVDVLYYVQGHRAYFRGTVLRVITGAEPPVSIRFRHQTHYGVTFPQETTDILTSWLCGTDKLTSYFIRYPSYIRRRHTSYATLHTYADHHTSYAVLHTSTSNFILHLSYTIRVLPYCCCCCCCCCDDGSSIVGRRTAVQLYEWMAHVLAAGKVY